MLGMTDGRVVLSAKALVLQQTIRFTENRVSRWYIPLFYYSINSLKIVKYKTEN